MVRIPFVTYSFSVSFAFLKYTVKSLVTSHSEISTMRSVISIMSFPAGTESGDHCEHVAALVSVVTNYPDQRPLYSPLWI